MKSPRKIIKWVLPIAAVFAGFLGWQLLKSPRLEDHLEKTMDLNDDGSRTLFLNKQIVA